MEKCLTFLFLALIVTSFSFVYPQAYREVPQKKTVILKDNYFEIKDKYYKRAIDITCYLPKGYSVSGDIDYTSYLQKAYNENKVIIMPDFPIKINYKGLMLKNNHKILFQPNSKLIIEPNNQASYQALWIEGKENINVYFPKIEGDKFNHLNILGEWGMGIKIYKSQNVSIHGGIISQCWGDGLYIGGNSSNINISNLHVDNNRRNGISIISGSNIYITNTVISNTKGTLPECGIDIEPNSSSEVLNNIVINNVITYNNNGDGINIVLDNLVSEQQKHLNIRISNHKDYFSRKGIGIFTDRGYNLKIKKPLRGEISIQNCEYYFNKTFGMKSYKSRSNEINLNLMNIKTFSNNKNNILSDEDSQYFKKAYKKGEEFLVE